MKKEVIVTHISGNILTICKKYSIFGCVVLESNKSLPYYSAQEILAIFKISK